MSTQSKYVSALYQTRSFSKAAKLLYISQPALSMAINNIENDLGVKLFDRSTTPITPTQACEYYLSEMQKITHIEENMKEHFQQINDIQSGSFSIGSMTYYCCWTIPNLTHSFLQKYPNIKINMFEHTNNDALLEHLKSGELDLVLTTNHKGFESMEHTFVSHEHLILAVPADWDICKKYKNKAFTAKEIIDNTHRNAKNKGVNLKDFEELPYISLRPDSDLYSRSATIFHHYDAEANYAMYVDQMITEYFMTKNGYGYSIIRDGTVNIVPEDKNIHDPSVLYFILDDPLAIRDLNFYYRDKEYLNASTKHFLKQFD